MGTETKGKIVGAVVFYFLVAFCGLGVPALLHFIGDTPSLRQSYVVEFTSGENVLYRNKDSEAIKLGPGYKEIWDAEYICPDDGIFETIRGNFVKIVHPLNLAPVVEVGSNFIKVVDEKGFVKKISVCDTRPIVSKNYDAHLKVASLKPHLTWQYEGDIKTGKLVEITTGSI